MTNNRIHYLLKPNEKEVYFRNDFEDVVFRSVKGGNIYMKFKGKKEFKAPDNSEVVESTVIEKNIDFISKETYDNW
jgi:hypothetical protein